MQCIQKMLLADMWVLMASLAFPPAASLPAEAQAGLEPFLLPWDDASSGPSDVSFLLDPLAGGRGFISVKDGRFFSGDRRIRFWGVNVCFGACFPSREDAPRIAGRLAKFGVNCVRFHHMDMRAFPGGIFKDAKLQDLSPEALDRLDFFVSELAKRGIYSNLNLHVSRWISRALGWPGAGDLESFDKMVDIFHPELIALQRKYARDLLGHVNAYTGRRYADEPAVAMVEITNEDSLFQWGSMGALARLPEPYAGMLRGQWNAWLRKRYTAGEALREAWNKGAEPLGADQVRDADFATFAGPAARAPEWSCEEHEGADASIGRIDGPGGRTGVRVEIRKRTGVSWHVQLKQTKLSVKKGKPYTVKFFARAGEPRTIAVSVGQDQKPWGNLGLSRDVRLSPEWKLQTLGFTATADEEDVRVALILGGDEAPVELAAVSFQSGGRLGLLPGESLSAENIALFEDGGGVTEARIDDRLRFLEETERAFFVGMRAYLKEELGVRAPITGTIAFGALGTKVQAELDFVDQHAYWQHPQFPRRPWDSRDWIVPNLAMSAARGGGTLPGLASTRVLGKPYTVTEYLHPAPLDSQAETVPMIATFGAWQDWDGIFLFAYSHDGRFDRDRIHGFFDIDSNPAKMGFLGAGALIFSGGRLAPAPAAMTRKISPEEAVRSARMDPTHMAPFLREGGYSTQILLEARWAIQYAEEAEIPQVPAAAGPIRWSLEEGRERYVVDAPAVKAVCGRTAGTIDLEGVHLEVQGPAGASIALVSCDDGPLSKSRRMLLVACGRAENTGMGWNEERTSVGDRWGESPTRIEVVRAGVRIAGDPLKAVFALDGRGGRAAELPVTRVGESSAFRAGGGPPTLWYEITR